MSHTRADFRERIEEKRKADVRRSQRDLTQLAQATVPVDAVTHSAEWNFLLSLVQAEIERLNAVLVALTQAYAIDPSFDPVAMAEAKAHIQRVAVQRDTLQTVLRLPSEIMANGEKARLVLLQYADE